MENTILDIPAEGIPGKKDKPFIYILKYGGLLLSSWVILVVAMRLVSKIQSSRDLAETFSIFSLVTLAVIHIAVLITALRSYLRSYLQTSLLKLMFLGTAICASSIFIFAIGVRVQRDGIYDTFSDLNSALEPVVVITVIGLVLSFLISFQLKTQKTVWLILMIAALTAAGYLLWYFNV